MNSHWRHSDRDDESTPSIRSRTAFIIFSSLETRTLIVGRIPDELVTGRSPGIFVVRTPSPLPLSVFGFCARGGGDPSRELGMQR